jgi:uncharacterized iron-regulated protein
MPKGKRSTPKLVQVTTLPKNVRKSAYVALVEEFAKSTMDSAKLEGVKASASISAKKAVQTLGLKNIRVLTIAGEVYLTKE